MKPKHIIGAVIIAACLGAMFYFSKNFATPYVTFDEAAKAQGRQVQVMGELVKSAGAALIPESGAYEFSISDPDGKVMRVRTMKGLPSNFEQATQVVAKGAYEDGIFIASDILTKCPSKYEAKADEAFQKEPGE